ncbi:elongation factor P maturation arginine rhamnosyltransferase EarP [Methyloversatilis thermotolerans]|uniref:elongation factor P maturation arginine rhamnosyltransferase EarP n=1 Tax=Methyloversatilis thermotolerans TaxID=1346290 RepID=UPI000376B6A2|nr:elongation factor P maturation arginine rhamnosyltransferase EarP [Methyloversatilis thermotolerans]
MDTKRSDNFSQPPAGHPDCDLFCRVVDNFGDIGVCWRLARCLAREHGWSVRLWVDAPESLAKIAPEAASESGITVLHWTDNVALPPPAGCVIEAFGCSPPAAFVSAMAQRQPAPRWINLEYLSAEDWVDGCHRLPSIDPATGLRKYFFFPGFTPGTGGLLRERNLFVRRDAWRAAHAAASGVFHVSLFAYENPSIPGLLTALRTAPHPSHLWVPEGRALASLNAQSGLALSPGDCVSHGTLTVSALPFMDQDDYDALLWRCDLNLVRGEDSFVRAQWAARPFVWQIYPQQEDAHIAKLDAFFERYAARLSASCRKLLQRIWRGWNTAHPVVGEDWHLLVAVHAELQAHAVRWADELARQDDLATQLVLFNQTPI